MNIHIGKNIKRIAEQRKLSATMVAYKWVNEKGKSHTPQAVHNLYNNHNPGALVVLEMCRILDVGLYDIYGIEQSTGEPVKSSATLHEFSDETITYLRQQIEKKDQQIEFLQEMIKKLQST